MNTCGNCKYAHSAGIQNMLNCHFHPPTVFMLMTQGLSGGPQPVGISMRPSVTKDSPACANHADDKNPALKMVSGNS